MSILIKLIEKGAYLLNGTVLVEDIEKKGLPAVNEEVRAAGFKPLGWLPEDKVKDSRGTIAAGIIAAHNAAGTEDNYKIRFDLSLIHISAAAAIDEFSSPFRYEIISETLLFISSA